MIPSASLFGRSTRRRVQLHDSFVSASGDGIHPITAKYMLYSDGFARDNFGSTIEQWCLIGPTSDFEARATLISGGAGGTFDTWLSLSSTLEWRKTAVGAGGGNATFLLEIRLAATGTVKASANIEISVDGGA